MKLNSCVFPAAVCLLTLACGSSESHAHHPHEHRGGEHGGHHAKLGGAVKSFHDVLAPVYHMDKGAERVESACKAGAALKEHGSSVVSEAATEDAKTRTTKLSVAVTALEKACLVEGRATVETDLEAVHEAFHAVIEAK